MNILISKQTEAWLIKQSNKYKQKYIRYNEKYQITKNSRDKTFAEEYLQRFTDIDEILCEIKKERSVKF